MKHSVVCGLLLPFSLHAQQVKESDIKVGKSHRQGFVATSKYGKTEVAEMMNTKFAEAGLKKHSKKQKFITYKGVTWQPTGSNKVDLYYRVTEKKHKARIAFIASNGYDNYITSANDAATAANITAYLSELDEAIARDLAVKQKQHELEEMDNKLEKEKANIKKIEDEKQKKNSELKELRKTESY